MNKYKVTFEPMGKTVEVEEGMVLHGAAMLAGVYIDTPCGGEGVCGACEVRVKDSDGVAIDVLACQYMVTRDLTVYPI